MLELLIHLSQTILAAVLWGLSVFLDANARSNGSLRNNQLEAFYGDYSFQNLFSMNVAAYYFGYSFLCLVLYGSRQHLKQLRTKCDRDTADTSKEFIELTRLPLVVLDSFNIALFLCCIVITGLAFYSETGDYGIHDRCRDSYRVLGGYCPAYYAAFSFQLIIFVGLFVTIAVRETAFRRSRQSSTVSSVS